MGEETKRIVYGTGTNVIRSGGSGRDVNGDGNRVTEWEEGLPTIEDLIPLSQALIPVVLMSAFSITPEPYRTSVEVNQASQDTLSSIRGNNNNHNNVFSSFNEESEMNVDLEPEGDSRKCKRIDDGPDSVMDDQSNHRGSKRPRLVWTPQLHKRFVDVVGHLGIANAVPKTIMQMMNVEGLTRENVASHLQKYRLYLKRMQGLSNEGPSSSDPLFGSTPVPPSLQKAATPVGSGHGQMQMTIPMPYHPPPQMMPMPVLGEGHMSMGSFPYGMMQQRDWSGNPFSSYPPVAPNGN